MTVTTEPALFSHVNSLTASGCTIVPATDADRVHAALMQVMGRLARFTQRKRAAHAHKQAAVLEDCQLVLRSIYDQLTFSEAGAACMNLMALHTTAELIERMRAESTGDVRALAEVATLVDRMVASVS